MHIGYAREFGADTVVSVDWTHVEGRNDFGRLNIDPIVNGVRLLAPDFLRVYGRANVLSATNILTSTNSSRYDGMTIQFQRRHSRATIQAHYTLSGAYAYGGVIAGRGGAPLPQDNLDPFAEGEWGPTTTNETHRVVVMSVIELPWRIQVSPVFQAASARPYTLTAGRDVNSDGQSNDRFIDPTTGESVSVNSEPGDPTILFDMRATKFFTMGAERRASGCSWSSSICSTMRTSATRPTALRPVLYLSSRLGSSPTSATHDNSNSARVSSSERGIA